MTGTLLQEAEQETRLASEERKYLRLSRDGKVFYITEAEAMGEKVLAGPRKKLSEEDLLVAEWNCRVERANQLKERISFVHQMMRDDDQRPSQYKLAYNTLWDEYRITIESLRELDAGAVDQFGDKVTARVKVLQVRLNTICDAWNPDDFEDFEKLLVLYEKSYDHAVALSQ